ncbi:MAG TPA: hypothetical protein VLT62_02095 [Candidatus Methylomirabilis sp.]|nr:hypothetical protein [Candidatus Methylomirabilis sp.]
MARSVWLHLSWRRNGDGYDVPLAVNRLLAHGHPVWWCLRPSGTAEAGDYLVEGPSSLVDRLSALGLSAAAWTGLLPRGARPLETPRICLLAGTASAYPYFAYYTLCLTRLGLSYHPVGGAGIAQGALLDANLLILPGGFAIWGLDMAEAAPGADASVRTFLEGGGACLGSCGGAYYLSAGRPAWTGTVQARPRYTHEYLQSGTGIASLRLADHLLALGCPATVEVPYYHGPIYEDVGPEIEVAATFDSLCLPGRLGIDNPMEARRFAREMAGRPAILRAEGARGRAVLFSPHPEMGDLVRKYVALDGYVRRYASIRGRRTLEETLKAYRPSDSPAFRLVLNATHALTMHSRTRRSAGYPRYRRGSRTPSGPWAPSKPARAEAPRGDPLSSLRSFQKAAGELLASLRVTGSTGYGSMVRAVAEDIAGRLAPAADKLDETLRLLRVSPGAEGRRILVAWNHLATQGTETLGQGGLFKRPAAERLLHVDLAICLWDAWRRLIETERLLASVRSGR